MTYRRLLALNVAGIKNIKEPISIGFSRTKDVAEIEPRGDNVRGIYGPNGSGKTALALALHLLARLVRGEVYLSGDGQRELLNLINYERRSLDLELDFASFKSEAEEGSLRLEAAYRYRISIALRDENGPLIVNEALSRFNGKYLSSKLVPVFRTHEGKVEELWLPEEDPTALRLRSDGRNIVARQSFLSFLRSSLAGAKEKKGPLFEAGADVQNAFLLFDEDLRVAVQQGEESISPAFPFGRGGAEEKGIAGRLKKMNHGLDLSGVLVKKDQLPEFEAFLNRKAKFIKLFKPHLQGIAYEKRDLGTSCLCTEIIDYGAYAVSASFEGAGIQKLMKLFAYIDGAYRGEIVLVDELDAYLSGTCLEKLIAFLNNFGSGQFIFTAHSLEAMKPLSSHGKSIYFISPSNRAYVWRKNSHYKPYILYPEGMIGDIDFDLGSFDFLQVFSPHL